MVDLPTELGRGTLQAPQSAVSSADVSRPYADLAVALEKSGQAASTVANSLAEQAGYKAVTRDADGNIQIEKAPIIGPASQHYAHAVKIAALAEGEGEARRKDIELRTKFRNDPQGYVNAADAFMKQMEDQYTKAAGPEVGIALRRTLEPITTQTYRGLLNEKERLDLYRSYNAITSEMKVTENQMQAMARGGVTSGPDWERAASKYNTLSASLVNNPRLAYPQEQANAEKQQFFSELGVQGAMHHVVDQIYPQKGYDEAVKAADEIRTSPKLNLTPAQRETAHKRIIAELNSRERDARRLDGGIAQDIERVNQLAIKGYTVPPEQIAQVREAVGTSKNPALAGALAQTEATVATMKQWSTMNPVQLEASLADLNRTMKEKGTSEHGLKILDAGEKLLGEMRKGVGADPLGWSTRTGVMDVPPIQFGSQDALAQMTDRVSRSEIIAQHYGIAPTYLRPDEVDALQVATAKGGTAMVGVAETLANGFGDRAPRVMAELSKDAPTLAHVGALVSSGGNQPFAMDVAEASRLRNDLEAAKTLPHWFKNPSDKIMAAQNSRRSTVYGDAFILTSDVGRAAEGAARDAYSTRAVRRNLDPLDIDHSGDSQKAYDKALQESAGARTAADGTQYGGVGDYKTGFFSSSKVIVPPNVRTDRFRDVIGAIKDDDLSMMGISPQRADGKPYKAAELQAAVPIAVKGGYRFALGDPTSTDPRYIQGADGKPFVLDFDQMETRLRQRVPGAFIGTR